MANKKSVYLFIFFAVFLFFFFKALQYMFCILAFPLGGVIRNMNILLADILLIFILYISFNKGVPPAPRPRSPGRWSMSWKDFVAWQKLFRPF